MKKLLAVLCASLTLWPSLAMAATNQQSPSKGDTLAPRTMPNDGSGKVYTEDHFLGYKVFEDSNSSTAVLLADEAGNNPTCGAVHVVCIAARQDVSGNGIQYAQVTETAAVGGAYSGRQPGNLVPGLASADTKGTQAICQAVDAQFNGKISVWNSGTDIDTLVYWMPCAGANPR